MTDALAAVWADYDALAGETLRARMAALYPKPHLHERGVAHGVAYTILTDSPDEGRIMVDGMCLGQLTLYDGHWLRLGDARCIGPATFAELAENAIADALEDLAGYGLSLLRVALGRAHA